MAAEFAQTPPFFRFNTCSIPAKYEEDVFVAPDTCNENTIKRRSVCLAMFPQLAKVVKLIPFARMCYIVKNREYLSRCTRDNSPFRGSLLTELENAVTMTFP